MLVSQGLKIEGAERVPPIADFVSYSIKGFESRRLAVTPEEMEKIVELDS